MENEIAKLSGIKTVPFAATTARFRKGEYAVYKLIMHHIEINEPITKAHMVECYLSLHGDTEFSAYIGNGEYRKRPMREASNYHKELNAFSFFKRNLATAIINGKILAIPVIDI